MNVLSPPDGEYEPFIPVDEIPHGKSVPRRWANPASHVPRTILTFMAAARRQVLTRIAAGDQSAVRDLIDTYGDLIWSLARHFTNSHAESEEAVQDIFIYLWQKAGMYEPAAGAEDTFISVLTRRRLIDRWRRESRHAKPAAISDDAHPSSLDSEPMSEDASLARTLFDSLSEEERIVLRLSIAFGQTHQKIADHTGMPLGTVKTVIRRALIQIRDQFSADGATQEGRSPR